MMSLKEWILVFKPNEEIEEDNKLEKLFAFCLILTIPLFGHMFLNEKIFPQSYYSVFFGFTCLH